MNEQLKTLSKKSRLINEVKRYLWFKDTYTETEKNEIKKRKALFQLESLFIATLVTSIFICLFVYKKVDLVKKLLPFEFKTFIVVVVGTSIFLISTCIFYYYLINKKKLFQYYKLFKFSIFVVAILSTYYLFYTSFLEKAMGGEFILIVLTLSFFNFFILLNNLERLIYDIIYFIFYFYYIFDTIKENEMFYTTIFHSLMINIFFYVLGSYSYKIWVDGVRGRLNLSQNYKNLDEKSKMLEEFANNQKSILENIYSQMNIPFTQDLENAAPLLLSQRINSLISINAEILKETEQVKDKYLDIFNNVNDGILILDKNKKIVDINRKTENIVGKEMSSIINKTVEECFPLMDVELFYQYQNSLVDKLSYNKLELELEHKEGEDAKYIEMSSSAIVSGNNYNGERIIVRDITDRKKTERELINSRNIEKKFLNNMSHEIRTPLNAIIGISHLLGDTKLDNEQNELLKAILNSSEFLYNLISDVLDISKMESNKMEVKKRDIDLVGVLKSLRQGFELKMTNDSMRFDLFIDPKIQGFYSTDDTLLNQVLYNLIGNAVKFTTKGVVGLKVKQIKIEGDIHWLEFNVFDSGIGIEPKNLNLIFDKFKQIESQTEAKTKGTGLGLAITKEIIGLMGGEIRVESEIGIGSQFIFTFPFEKVKNDLVAKAEKDKIIRNELSNQFIDLLFLVVEDNIMNQKYIGTLFKNKGINFEMVNNGLEAVEKCKEKKYDVILMDIQMPVMDGLEATINIRNTKNPNKDSLIFALTASDVRDKLKEALSVGMNDLISKPFTPSEIFEKIEINLNKKS